MDIVIFIFDFCYGNVLRMGEKYVCPVGKTLEVLSGVVARCLTSPAVPAKLRAAVEAGAIYIRRDHPGNPGISGYD